MFNPIYSWLWGRKCIIYFHLLSLSYQYLLPCHIYYHYHIFLLSSFVAITYSYGPEQ